MKTSNTTPHDQTHTITSTTAGNAPERLTFKLGLDVDLRQLVVASQCERGLIGAAQQFTRAQLIAWVKEKIAAGHAVHTVYECCGFGYTLHEELSAAGAHCLLTTPGWGGPRKWKALAPQCSDFVRAQLEPVVKQIRDGKAHLDRLTAEIQALVAQEKIPKGLGALTVSLLDGEVCDWTRFTHRKAIGSYTGCCPSEHSSGGVQRFGHIDRHGNKHVRVLLVEAVWRLLKWQPFWHARQKFLARLKHGASLKKKTAVALARQLAIDLWRWRTGRATAAELGWLVKE
jgi:hypothetical protein